MSFYSVRCCWSRRNRALRVSFHCVRRHSPLPWSAACWWWARPGRSRSTPRVGTTVAPVEGKGITAYKSTGNQKLTAWQLWFAKVACQMSIKKSLEARRQFQLLGTICQCSMTTFIYSYTLIYSFSRWHSDSSFSAFSSVQFNEWIGILVLCDLLLFPFCSSDEDRGPFYKTHLILESPCVSCEVKVGWYKGTDSFVFIK